jgi:hypothetical protein
VLTLKNEAETVAAYLADSRRMDPPELAAPERSVIPLWIRVIDGARIVAATPGIPDLPILEHPQEAGTADFVRFPNLDVENWFD